MQNKFGLKDFVLLVLVCVVGVLAWMGMRQDDRRWEQNKTLLSKVGSIEQQIARLEAKLESGVIMTGGGGANAGGVRDESWAVPGVEIEWQPPWCFSNDPRDDEGYRLGGSFTEVFEAQPSKITPVLAEDVYGRRIYAQVVESLATWDPETLAMRGLLAEAWQQDPEGMWVRVKIRDNARFSDGKPVTAEDVRWSFHDYINNPELETESLRSIMTSIDRVEVISDKVCEIHFKWLDAYNLQSALLFGVLPKHFYERFTPSQINQSTGLLVGSGPFKLENLDPDDQWSPGEVVTLVRNEQYWGPKPALERLRYFTIDNDIARLVAYQNGETDMILPSSPQFAEKEREPGFEDTTYMLKWVNMRSGYNFIGWQCGPRNGKLTPFADKRVRQAMTMLLDRDLMIRDIWQGIGAIAVGPNNPPSPAAAPDVQPLPYDPQRARELLAEAGWMDRDGNGILENENGQEFVFEFTRASGGQTIERMQKYLIDQCASVGIRCIPRIVDWSQYDQIMKNRDFDAITLGWSASAPESDPKQIWHPDSIQNQGHNFIQWDAGQGPIIDKIKSTLDTEERMALFHELHRLIHEEQPYTFVRVVPWTRFISKKFENVHPYASGLEQREFYLAPVPTN